MKFEAYLLSLENGSFLKNEPSVFSFELDENENPRKLGDGSFGVVYKVIQEVNEREYAVKLFYYREEGKQINNNESQIKHRFFNELNYYRQILAKRKNPKNDLEIFNPTGIIEPHKATTEFTSSEAYKALFGEKGKMSDRVRVSNYAIVLPLYEGTLKDLLENKTIPRNKKQNISGYEILKETPANLRILTMIPILNTIIGGLKSLYIGEFKHLDIKPANIFYRVRGNDDLEFTLADMGYLDTRSGYLHTMVMSDDQVQALLGTLSYRSPEQVDYFDRCDAKVLVDGPNVSLIVNDPKFRSTLIREKDLVFFSKSNNRKAYVIREIIWPNEEHPGAIVIKIDQDFIEDGTTKIVSEEKTQVEFRKVQGIKTDLFGLGAIALDLLTAGASPENFYQMIKNRDLEEDSVQSIISDYRNVDRSQNEKAEATHIFKILRIGNDYADERIVSFILKCMLFNAKGTFVENFKGEKHIHNIFDTIGNELKGIRNHIVNRLQGNNTAYDEITYRLLIKKDIDEKISESRPELSYKLKEIFNTDNNKYYWRLARGVKYLDMIISYIRRAIYDKESQYFIECYPRNLWFSNESNNISLKSYITFAPNEKDYIEHIEGDVVINNLNASYTNYFVPDEIAYMRREILLKETGDKTENGHYFYDLLSKSPTNINLKADDWIVQSQKAIRVKSVNFKDKTLILDKSLNQRERKGLLSSEYNSDWIPVVYYHNIDRLKYYLQIIATYIHQLIFAGQGTWNNKEIPRKIQLVRNSLISDYEIRIPNSIKEDNLEYVYYRLGELYTKLILTEYPKSFYQSFHSENLGDARIRSRDVMVKISKELKDIIGKIENIFFGKIGFITEREVAEFDLAEVFDKNVLEGIQISNGEFINFEKIIEEIITENSLENRVYNSISKFKSWFKSNKS